MAERVVRVLRALFYYDIWLVFQFDIICRLYIFSLLLSSLRLAADIVFIANYAQQRDVDFKKILCPIRVWFLLIFVEILC